MANFKLAKKNALSDTRTTLFDLHQRKLDAIDNEKTLLNKYTDELHKCREELKKDTSLHSVKTKIDILENKIKELSTNQATLIDEIIESVKKLNNEKLILIKQLLRNFIEK